MKYLLFSTVVLALGWTVSAQDKTPPIEEVVTIEFPQGGYTFTLAEAAKGIKIDYTIRISQDYPGVIALQTRPSFHEPPGPSGLHPHESITGQGQLYSLQDFGLAFPPKEVTKTIKKGTYRHTFEWDGRNWTGPSDFGNPKGKPFPVGTYDLTVTLQGKVVAGQGTKPYHITGKTKLVLK